jgi:hypothetical protein
VIDRIPAVHNVTVSYWYKAENLALWEGNRLMAFGQDAGYNI